MGLLVLATAVTCYPARPTTGYGAGSPEICGEGEEQNIYGKCVEPEISQNLFLFRAPDYKVPWEKAYYEHKPKINVNLVFIRSPSYKDEKRKPIVVPPPKQQTLVYLLSKKPDGYKQDIIEVPLDQARPEVFFVDYKEGDNPLLPGGIDLQTALSQSNGPSDSNLNVQTLGVQSISSSLDNSHSSGGSYISPRTAQVEEVVHAEEVVAL